MLVKGPHESSGQRTNYWSETRSGAMAEKDCRAADGLYGDSPVVVTSKESVKEWFHLNRVAGVVQDRGQPTETSIQGAARDPTFWLMD